MDINPWCIRNQNHSKKRKIFDPYVLGARKTRARTRTRGKFLNAQNGLKCTLVWSKLNFEYFLILTRAYARVMTRMMTWMYMMLDIDLKSMSVKLILKMTFSYEDMINYVTQCQKNKMAPTWRHAWLIVMKNLLIQLHGNVNDHDNFHDDWIMKTDRSGYNKFRKKERRTRHDLVTGTR